MPAFLKILGPLVLIALLVATLYGSNVKAPKLSETVEVHQVPVLQVDRLTKNGEPKAEVYDVFTNKKHPDVHLGISLFDGGRVVRIDKEDADDWDITTRHRYLDLWDPYWDFGAWTAARPGTNPGYDLGIRVSPARLLYGTISPDALIGSRSFGLGASAYIPPGWIPRSFDRFGVGIAYLADYGGRQSGWAPYLSLSTRF